MKIILNKFQLLVVSNNEEERLILKGIRSSINCMQYLNIYNESELVYNIIPTNNQLNSMYQLRKQKDIIEFLVQSIQNPIPKTWINNINSGFFLTWPGLIAALVNKNYTKKLETVKGHMKADRKKRKVY